MLKKPVLRNQKGISMIEIIPVLLVFAVLFNFALGFFGVIHTGIVNSIASRNYAFETFRNRANLNYLRDIPTTSTTKVYSKYNYRFHGVVSEGKSSDENEWYATKRPIKFTEAQSESIEKIGTTNEHNELVRQIKDSGKVSDIFTGKTKEEGRSGVSPVWVQTLYGMCLNAKCRP